MNSILSFPQLKLVSILRLNLDHQSPEKSNLQDSSLWFNIVSGSTVWTDASSPAPNLEVRPGSGDFATYHPEHDILSLDVRIVAKDKSKGDMYMLEGRGFVDAKHKKIQDILNGEKTAESTRYGEGNMIETVSCRTSSEDFGWMKFACLIADGRLIVEDGMFVAVELRLFKVGHSTNSHVPTIVVE